MWFGRNEEKRVEEGLLQNGRSSVLIFVRNTGGAIHESPLNLGGEP